MPTILKKKGSTTICRFTRGKALFIALVIVMIFPFSDPVLSQAIDFKSKKIQIALGDEPPELNSLKSTDQISFFVLEHVMEGLLAYDANGALVPGIAERWELDELGAKFHLRKNARWSDGKIVTAHDFVFAWRMVVNPLTASRYAFILAPLKNAERISAGELAPEALGVKALDDFTLEVSFERPCAYFLSLTTFATYFPVREDFYKQHQDRYFADVKNMIFNGPYRLSSWVHGASLQLDKNPTFWNADTIQINTIDVPFMSADLGVWFNLFRNDEIVYADLDNNSIKSALQERMYIKNFNLGAVEYISFNHRKNKITANKNFRKAIQLVFDPKDLVYKVLGMPGNKPAYSMFPSWLNGIDDKLYKEIPPIKTNKNIAKAKEYLELAKTELNLEKIPPLILLSSDRPLTTKKAEYLQELLKNTLGINLKIDKQIFKQRIEKMVKGEFDLALASWGPDYNDPSTFGDLFYSKNSNNHGRYKNKDYDYWVEQAMNSTDKKIRLEAFAVQQKIIEENAVVLPQFERGIVYVENPHIKGITRRIFGGDPSFRYARIKK